MIQLIFEKTLVILDNYTQYKNLNFIKKIYGNELDIFLDVGCHKGETINLISKLFTIKKIFAFDANKELIKNNKKSKKMNVIFISKGLGSVNGKKKMLKYKFSPINSFIEENYNSKYKEKRNKFLNFIYGTKNQKTKVLVDLIRLE